MSHSARAKADNHKKQSAEPQRRIRAISRQRSHKNTNETKLSRSHSVEQSKKIFNAESNYDIFSNVSQVFKDILSDLEIDVNCEEVREKLIAIKSLIDRKLLSISMLEKEKNKSKRKASSLSNLLTSSTLSINSEQPDICLDDNSFFKTFMTEIDCPFCSKSMTDKNSFIKHLDENCLPHKNKKFIESSHIPFSAFQILPNNSFKCNVCSNSVVPNIKSYITHKLSSKHTLFLQEATKTKFYSEYLFCSCCKILVPNNYTQLVFHIEHQFHKARQCSTPKFEDYLSQRIYCVFIKREKFKCLVCFNYQCDSPKEILKHFEQPIHMKRVKKNYLSVIYCEFCCVNVPIFEITRHLMSREHKRKVEKIKERDDFQEDFELCFFCGFVCHDLKTLSWHMESKCQVINEMRDNFKSITQEKQTSGGSKDEDEAKFKNSTEEEYCIIVKDNVNVTKLFKYFTEFGQISAMEIYNEKDVKIKFCEKKIVEDILMLQNVLQIDGEKLKITTHETVLKPKDTINESSNITFGENKKNSASNIGEMDESDDSESVEGEKLQNLFERVSSYLESSALKLEYEFKKKLAEDCAKALKVETCEFVGFSGCELMFPAESQHLYCSVELKEFSYLNKSERLHINLLKALYLNMCVSELWKDVCLCFDNCFPQIVCEHKETQTSCTIVVAQSAVVLTNMLRDCLKNIEVRSFCLIMRFWLSVHGLNIRKFDYVIISILIFFLMSEKIVNFPIQKYAVSNFKALDEMIKAAESKELHEPTSGARVATFGVKELFQKFLLFLNTFDFDNYAICLPVEHPVPKAFLMKNEIEFYGSKSDRDQLLRSPMCILQPVTFRNLAEQVEEQDKKSLLKIVKSTIKHYKFQ